MDEFRERLTDAGRRFGVRRLAGALLKDGDILYAACAPDAFGADAAQPIFCLAKILTASLIAQAIQSGRLALTDRLDALFETGPLKETDGAARGVTIFHLLSHTHGWEGAPDPDLRRTSDGFIAPQAILRDLTGRPRLYEPGEMYSYDTAGYLLLGAILEKLHRARFGALLHHHLLGPLGIETAELADIVCPAEGYEISLSVRALSRLVEYHLAPERFEHALPNAAQASRLLQSHVLDTPGWSPFYKGTTLAWRELGSGWLSHEGVGPLGSAYSMVRLNPGARTALILMSPEPRSRLLGAQLFNDISRSNLTADFALPLSGDALREFDPEPFFGTYGNGRNQTTILLDGHGQLQASLTLAGGPRADIAHEERALQPATRDVLFLKAPIGRRHFIQPLRSSISNEFTHAWDGYEVARRLS
ncbi:MAG TPA: serine hydrolase domain-containing protein [Caulobacterales bacterium]|nr:serine hydrolase domain-containing protein [Caulobacterales bacterium]